MFRLLSETGDLKDSKHCRYSIVAFGHFTSFPITFLSISGVVFCKMLLCSYAVFTKLLRERLEEVHVYRGKE